MKKIALILILALTLLTLSACKVDVALGNIAEQLHEANAEKDNASADDGQPASAADVEYDVEETDGDRSEAEEASSTDTGSEPDPMDLPEEILENVPEEADLTALSLEELVGDADYAPGKLPQILPSCPGGAWINDDIQGTFGYLVEDEYCTLWYDAYKNGEILSILIAENFDTDSSFYTPYNLDLTTGQRLTGEELLDRLGAEKTVLGDTELELMGREFSDTFGGMSEGDLAPFYQEQYDRTVSNDNAEFNRVWLGFGGELYFVARIFAMAGPEYMEYPLATGLIYR